MATATMVRFTPEDLLSITDRPMPELVDGELVEREPMGQKADAIAARILLAIGIHIDAEDLGLLNGAQGSYQVFPNHPERVRIPDVSFTRRDRLPVLGPAEGHSRVAPDLAVEVISPNDNASELRSKIRDYLSAGIPLIWVVNPETRDIEVIGGDGRIQLLGEGDSLDGRDILPGFSLPVSKLFARL